MKNQRAIIVVGHVDHGKTSLVKALTGIETDRLAEEKQRGLTIELGFAFLESDQGALDFIDAPGHENFIRNMISGAAGVSSAMIVVDARQGVEAQTTEHLVVCKLLGVSRFHGVISKTDAADAAQVAATQEDLIGLTGSLEIELSDISHVSSTSGEGVDGLKEVLLSALDENPAPKFPDMPFLPIDRAFSAEGAGAIVTGTLRRGVVKTGDSLRVLPAGLNATVRQMQNHGRMADSASPGMRVAVNLRGVKAEQLGRGMTLCPSEVDRPMDTMDVSVRLLGETAKPLRSGDQARVLFATTSAVARLRLYEGQSVSPGESGFMRLQFNDPVVATPGMRYVLRRLSPAETIGGGVILDPNPGKKYSNKQAQTAWLRALEECNANTALPLLAERHWPEGVLIDDAGYLLNKTRAETVALCEQMKLRVIDGRIFTWNDLKSLETRIRDVVESFHRNHPTYAGMPVSKLMVALDEKISKSLLETGLNSLLKDGSLLFFDGTIAAQGFDPFQELSNAQKSRIARLEAALQDGGLSPPNLEDFAEDKSEDEKLVRLLIEFGRVKRMRNEALRRNVYFHQSAVSKAEATLQKTFPFPQGFTVSEARAALDTTRKYIVPLLEYFDREGLTRRNGDVRTLRPESEE